MDSTKATSGRSSERRRPIAALRALAASVRNVRRLPRRAKRGLVVAAVMGLLLAGYGVYTAQRPATDLALPAVPSETPDGDASGEPGRSEAVIVVGPGDAAEDSAGGSGDQTADGGEAEAPGARQGTADGRGGTGGSTRQPVPSIWPVSGEVGSVFGWGHNETMDDWRYHPGVDITADTGSPVLAAGDGTVTKVALDSIWGWVAEIEHGPGHRTRYANLESVAVMVGDSVSAGDVIGAVGQSSPFEADAQAHVHFEVIWDGQPIDPLTILPAGS